MLDKKIVYTLKTSTLDGLSVTLEEQGTAIILQDAEGYILTLSVSEVTELLEILKELVNDIHIIQDMKKDVEPETECQDCGKNWRTCRCWGR